MSAQAALQHSGAKATDASAWANRERCSDRLFGVWSSVQRAFVYPDFQFTVDGIHPRLPELLRVLRTRVGLGVATTDRGGWARAYWLYQPDARLSEHTLVAEKMDLRDVVAASHALREYSNAGRTPAAMFTSQAGCVIALAKNLPAVDAAA